MYDIYYEIGGGLKPEFIDGVRSFIDHALTLNFLRKINWLGVLIVHVGA